MFGFVWVLINHYRATDTVLQYGFKALSFRTELNNCFQTVIRWRVKRRHYSWGTTERKQQRKRQTNWWLQDHSRRSSKPFQHWTPPSNVTSFLWNPTTSYMKCSSLFGVLYLFTERNLHLCFKTTWCPVKGNDMSEFCHLDLNYWKTDKSPAQRKVKIAVQLHFIWPCQEYYNII